MKGLGIKVCGLRCKVYGGGHVVQHVKVFMELAKLVKKSAARSSIKKTRPLYLGQTNERINVFRAVVLPGFSVRQFPLTGLQ